jgi:regulator of protease activity HflC (stomatin/prohibitin superfamily)
MVGYIVLGSILFLILFVILPLSLKIIRPTERGLVETFGKYSRFAKPGLTVIIPIIERIIKIDITEMMVSSEKREIITADSLNAVVDSNVYFKVKPDEESVKASEYNVYDYETQIVALAKTTLRNIIGTMTLKQANSERDSINKKIYDQLSTETKNWGIEIVRTELKEITPPDAVQKVMNSVVVANNEKIAAQDFATANETKADGMKRASIKEAEGKRQAMILEAEAKKQAQILVAEGEAEAIKLVNESADKYFKGNAVELKKLQTTVESLSNNTKIVVPAGQSLVNVMGDIAGIGR